MATLKTPNKFHSAYNPINFEVYDVSGKQKEYRLTIAYTEGGKSQSCQLLRRIPGLTDSSGTPGLPGLPGLPGESGAPGLPGESAEIHPVTFDVSGVVRTLFGKDAPEMKESVEADNRLFVRYTCEGQEYIALNTVDTISLSSSDLTFGEKLLSSLPVFRKYEGYDFDISLLCGNDVTAPFTPFAVNRVKPTAIPIRYLKDKEGYILDEEGNYILIDGVNIIDTPVPRNPFYVRWINRLGGVDYWMFGVSQQISIGVKDADTLLNYSSGFNTTLGVEVETSVYVGASGVSRQEWEILSLLPLSPHIEWYNEKSGKWVTITARKSENTMDTDLNIHDMDFAFGLPNLKTQFA